MLARFPLNPILPAADGPRAEAFLVEGIEDLVAGLRERGAAFVDPQPASFAGTEGAIDGYVIDFGPVKSTWLHDSEGNILALNEIAPAPPPPPAPPS